MARALGEREGWRRLRREPPGRIGPRAGRLLEVAGFAAERRNAGAPRVERLGIRGHWRGEEREKWTRVKVEGNSRRVGT